MDCVVLFPNGDYLRALSLGPCEVLYTPEYFGNSEELLKEKLLEAVLLQPLSVNPRLKARVMLSMSFQIMYFNKQIHFH